MPLVDDTISRRQFLRTAGLAGLAAATHPLKLLAATVALPFENGERPLVRYPQKRPLIRLTTRPPQLETPFEVFDDGLVTPNDAFFVRYHLSEVPLEIDPAAFRVAVGGRVKSPLTLSLADLKTKYEAVEVVAVNQCSGNGRGFSSPRVAGGQMGNGAMGNARWKGARLKDVLDAAGALPDAKQVSFTGLDRPVGDKTPGFVKALDVESARGGEVLLAYEMNGAELPMLNGYPLRLVVPGYYGTYWVKHLSRIDVLAEEFQGYWMKTAYRIPDNDCACVAPGAKPDKTRPIRRLNVRSFITSPRDKSGLKAGRTAKVRGIAFDGGSGIKEVAFSDDGGRSWRPGKLGEDLGRYSFREWMAEISPATRGVLDLRCRATANSGETQPLEPRWNPPGYMRNVVESVRVRVA